MLVLQEGGGVTLVTVNMLLYFHFSPSSTHEVHRNQSGMGYYPSVGCFRGDGNEKSLSSFCAAAFRFAGLGPQSPGGGIWGHFFIFQLISMFRMYGAPRRVGGATQDAGGEGQQCAPSK